VIAASPSTLRRIGLPAGLVGAGVGLSIAGCLVQGAVGGLNVNGATGAWPVILAGTASVGVGLLALDTGRPWLVRWRDLPIGIAAGVVVLAALDVAELVRGIEDAVAGGILGMAGRVVAAIGSAILLGGVAAKRRSTGGGSWLAATRGSPSLHLARLGALTVLGGWIVLVTQGHGFALRTIDAAALLAAIAAGLGLGSVAAGGLSSTAGRISVAGACGFVVVVALDTVLVVVGNVGPLVAGGVASAGGYVLYVAGVAILGAGGTRAVLAGRPPTSVSASAGS